MNLQRENKERIYHYVERYEHGDDFGIVIVLATM
jgi:hypothetical protein